MFKALLTQRTSAACVAKPPPVASLSVCTVECRSFYERIKKNGAGLFTAHHPHYRHKRYNKSSNQLRRLKGKFVLPAFMQRKLRKAGF
jgi:ribosomal protein L35